MCFHSLQERGIALEKQFRNWSELNVKPDDKNNVDPYTQCRVITLNGAKVEAAVFSHHLARDPTDMDIKRQLATVRRIEQQQQKAVSWLTPGEASILEVTIGDEQVAVDLTARVAQNEPDSDTEAILPKELPDPVTFHSNREHVREVLASQVDLCADLALFVPAGDLPADHRLPSVSDCSSRCGSCPERAGHQGAPGANRRGVPGRAVGRASDSQRLAGCRAGLAPVHPREATTGEPPRTATNRGDATPPAGGVQLPVAH